MKLLFNACACALMVAAGFAQAESVKPKVTRALAAEQGKAALAARKLPPRSVAEPRFGPPAQLPALSVDDIVARNVRARGGEANWAAVHAITYEGKLDAGTARVDGGQIAMGARPIPASERRKHSELQPQPAAQPIQLPYRLDLERPHRMRLEIPFAGQTALQVYDGQNGWKLRPFLGRHDVEPYTPEEMHVAAGEHDLDGPLIGHRAKGVKVALDGTEMVDGRGTYRLKLTMPDGEVRRLWIDGSTFLEAKIEGAARQFDGRLRPVVTYLRDWRTEGGLQVPHEMETRIEGVHQRQPHHVVVETVRINPALDATRFAKPS